jgi:hypothetical protein
MTRLERHHLSSHLSSHPSSHLSHLPRMAGELSLGMASIAGLALLAHWSRLYDGTYWSHELRHEQRVSHAYSVRDSNHRSLGAASGSLGADSDRAVFETLIWKVARHRPRRHQPAALPRGRRRLLLWSEARPPLAYLLTCLLAYLLAYLLTCLLAYLLTYLLACLLTYMLASYFRRASSSASHIIRRTLSSIPIVHR